MDTKEKYKTYVNTSFVAAVEPIVIDSAKGVTCYDENGNTYIDCFAGISVTNTGHGNEMVINAAKVQMDNVNARIIGVVLNGIRSEMSVDFQDYKYQGYYYAYEEDKEIEPVNSMEKIKKLMGSFINRFV